MHGEGKKRKGGRAKGHGGLEKRFEFYALLATRFSVRLRLVRRREGRRWGPTRITAVTALTIHLFHVEIFPVAFSRVLQRALWPKRFLC